MRTVLGVLGIALVVVVVGCRDESDAVAPTTRNDQSPSTEQTPQQFSDVVNLRDNYQVVLRWSGDVPSGGPGVVIWRTSGDLTRWDSVVSEDEDPSEGSFNIFRKQAGRTDIFGCIWVAVPGSRSEVRADCGRGGAMSTLDAGVGLALVDGAILQRLPARTILGREATCYEVKVIDELCVDEVGRVLYASMKVGDRVGVYEATNIFDVAEPVSWLAIANDETPTTLDDVTPAHGLEFPAAFHLGGEDR